MVVLRHPEDAPQLRMFSFLARKASHARYGNAKREPDLWENVAHLSIIRPIALSSLSSKLGFQAIRACKTR